MQSQAKVKGQRHGSWAVIFTSVRPSTAEIDETHGSEGDGYAAQAQRMMELAQKQEGFLGVDSARSADGKGITVSYWNSLEAIAAWKANSEHREAQKRGRDGFYKSFSVHICKVERAYQFSL